MKKVWIAGHNGLVGSALLRIFLKKKNFKILKIDKKKLDLRNQNDVKKWVKRNQPDIIINAAAKVGGIKHNANFPANFIYDNLMISINIINAAYKNWMQSPHKYKDLYKKSHTRCRKNTRTNIVVFIFVRFAQGFMVKAVIAES